MAGQRASDRLGADGESYAEQWLAHTGMQTVDRNWRWGAGQIDLIMLDGGELVFVEVKTRKRGRTGPAAGAVSWRQQQTLLRAAQVWLLRNPSFQDRLWRIDLLAIDLSPDGSERTVHHLPNAVVSG